MLPSSNGGGREDWGQFVHQVRRFDQRALLEVLARLSARGMADHLGDWNPRPPFIWTIAIVARVSLLAGTSRRAIPSDADAAQLCQYAFDLSPSEGLQTDAKVWLSALAAPQVALQKYMPHELARSWLVFVSPEFGTPLPAPDGLECTLEDALKATFVLFVWAKDNGGTIDLSLIDRPHMREVLSRTVSPDTLLTTAKSLAVSPERARELAHFYPSRNCLPERFGIDPLAQRPLVEVGGGRLLSPATHHIMRALTTNDLFFRLKDEQGEGMANELGRRFEKYVGRVLKESQFATLRPERKYRQDGKRIDSIDWFLVMSDRIVLVECKTTRLKNSALVDAVAEQSVWDAAVGKGLGQIANTARAIPQRRDEFADIPADLPFYGLVVTLEDLLMSVRRGRESNAVVPSRVATPADLEVFAMLDASQARDVLDHLYRGDNNTLREALGAIVGSSEVPYHPLLEGTWQAVSPLPDHPLHHGNRLPLEN